MGYTNNIFKYTRGQLSTTRVVSTEINEDYCGIIKHYIFLNDQVINKRM